MNSHYYLNGFESDPERYHVCTRKTETGMNVFVFEYGKIFGISYVESLNGNPLIKLAEFPNVPLYELSKMEYYWTPISYWCLPGEEIQYVMNNFVTLFSLEHQLSLQVALQTVLPYEVIDHAELVIA